MGVMDHFFGLDTNYPAGLFPPPVFDRDGAKKDFAFNQWDKLSCRRYVTLSDRLSAEAGGGSQFMCTTTSSSLPRLFFDHVRRKVHPVLTETEWEDSNVIGLYIWQIRLSFVGGFIPLGSTLYLSHAWGNGDNDKANSRRTIIHVGSFEKKDDALVYTFNNPFCAIKDRTFHCLLAYQAESPFTLMLSLSGYAVRKGCND